MQDKITMYTSLVVVAAVFRFGISTIMPSLFWFLGSKRARFDLTKPGGLGAKLTCQNSYMDPNHLLLVYYIGCTTTQN